MRDQAERHVGEVAMLQRYPIKSMLGERLDTVAVTARGVDGDRAWAVLDASTGKVASAKRPKLWRDLLSCSARTIQGKGEPRDAMHAEVLLRDGTRFRAGDPALDARLSTLTGRTVRLADTPPAAAEIDRAHPEAQIAAGLDADVAFDNLTLGGAAPAGTFLDYAPVHLITTATLLALAAAPPQGEIEPERYRPNVIIRSPSGTAAFPENEWLGGTVRIGNSVKLRVVLQTPRCSIPALAHGALPPRAWALRSAAERNRVEIPGFGSQPCAGIYAEVLREGTIRHGDAVTFTPDPSVASI